MARQIYLTILLSLFIFAATSVICQRESRRLATENFYRNFKSPCGPADIVSKRLGACMTEVLEVLEGKVPAPNSDAELIGYCTRFNNTQRCTRVGAKECLSGLHKTAASALATATQRWRTRECRSAESRARYAEPVRCAIRKGKDLAGVLQNHTSILQGIRDLTITPEEKLVKMCCTLNSLDKEIEARYNKECPQHTSLMIGIVHAMTDDARNTLCLSPKCSGALDKVVNRKYRPPQNMIEPILQILFQISTD